MSDLLDLVERCEAATGPNNAGLNTDIHEAIGNCVHRETEYYAVQSDTGFTCKACRSDTYGFSVPHYTASLDAAMTLVPTEPVPNLRAGKWWWMVETIGPTAHVAYENGDSGIIEEEGKATTPALALCAAALRARDTLAQHPVCSIVGESGADRALVSDQAASRLAPPGFDHGGSEGR